MCEAMAGVLITGAAYVPADPEWPAERVEFIAQDCGACCVLTAGSLVGRIRGSCPVFALDDLASRVQGVAGSRGRQIESGTVVPTSVDDCAYIIYTSGSTGRPKGVMVSHRCICHLVHAEGSVLQLRADDVVFQCASLSFDMSLEEIWPAWAAGACLLVATKERLRAGADLAGALAREGVTVWTCVPTLLALQEERIPSLRLLNLGGEACPPDLVRAWARPGLRILNTYGPTEATVTATFAELTPDAAVTIGRPLPNYSAYVLPISNDETKDSPGELGENTATGELCIGGPGVALGYVGRPELTAERFIANPYAAGSMSKDPLLYRTGDRVRLNISGELEFLGRIDAQVKIRGYRVELGEIESELMAIDGLKQAAVVMHRDDAGVDVLVAYIVPRPGRGSDEAVLRSRLHQRLPRYMVPDLFEPLPELPMLVSGKVDRNALPRPTRRVATNTTPLPRTAAERAVLAGCVIAFGRQDIGLEDDFFLQLGGHSLTAAALVSALRKDAAFRHVSMADVYNHATVAKLAACLDTSRPAPTKPMQESRANNGAVSTGQFAFCAAAQAIGLVFVYGLFSLQWLIPYLSYAWLYNQEGCTRFTAIAVSLTLYVVAIPVMLLIGIAGKWIILGRLRPGEYPLWGFTYYRWWLTRRLLATVPVNYLGRSPMLGFYYRLLGARIGRDVFLDSTPIDAPDCVAIGDRTAFGAAATLACCHVENGKLKVGRIDIGDDCYIGVSSVIARNAVMEARSVLDDLSLLPVGGRIAAGEQWAGSPAVRVSSGLRRGSASATFVQRTGFAFVYGILLLVFPLFAIIPVFPGMALMTELDQNTDAYGFMLLSPVLAVCFVATMCLQIAALKWLLVGRVKPERVSVFSFKYVRHWLVDQLMQLSLDVANSLYATLYLNPWYRLLGVNLGRRAEVSTASSISFDLLTVGDESFVADAVSLGAPRLDAGELILGRTTVGRRAFVGNSAVIPNGTTLGNGVLIGVLSVPPREAANAAKAGSSWFGTPAVYLPQRQVATHFDERSTFRPGKVLVAQRLATEFCRVILPSTVMIALTSLLMSWLVDLDDAGWSLGTVALLFPLLYVAYALTVAGFVAAVKWSIIGRYRPVEKPLWHHFVWRSELVTSLYENLAVPLFAEPLRGTPFLAVYLRLLGCRIGRRVYLDTTDVTEFDMVTIGDESVLNRECGPQTHLFEDRVMKISTVHIGARCVIGADSIVLYDARMEDDSQLGDLSMLMKGETLPTGTRWEGSPARPLADAGGAP